MPWYERDYAKQPAQSRPQLHLPKQTSIVIWLLAINIIVFIVDGILTRTMGFVPLDTSEGRFPLKRLEYWGYFSFDTVFTQGQVWRVLTFQFLHGNIMHLLGNMFGLFFFGHFIERYLGSRRFLAFYLLCGFAGTVAYILLWTSGFVVGFSWMPLVGASAGVFGVIIGVAVLAPQATVWVFGMFPMAMRTLAWLILGIAAYTVIAMGDHHGSNAGGEAAHLGGAALGALLIKRTELLKFALWGSGKSKSKSKPTSKSAEKKSAVDDAEVDRILDKVRDKGMDSLTARERATLQNATDAHRG